MTKKLERKLQRKNNKKVRKQAEKDMAQKLGLMDKMSNKCLTCNEPFDKNNREQVFSWHVVVRREEVIVNLYCPKCWTLATDIIESYKKHLEGKNG